MRKLLFLALLSMLAVTAFAQTPQTLTLGDPNVITTGYSPHYGYYDYSVTQIIYKSSELTAAGFIPGSKITSIAFQAAGTTISLTGSNAWDVRMWPTTVENFTAWQNPAGASVVFQGNVATSVPANTWLTITLSGEGYTYQANQHLLIQIVNTAGNWQGKSQSMLWNQHATDNPLTAFYYRDGTAYLPDLSNLSNPAQAGGGAYAVRPNLRVTFVPTAVNGYDLAINSFTAPAEIPGNTNMVIGVMNMGNVPIQAGQWGVNVYAGNSILTPMALASNDALLEPFSTGEITIIPTVYNAWAFPVFGNVTLKAELALPPGTNDIVPNNNIYETIVYNPGVRNLAMTDFTLPSILPTVQSGSITVKNVGSQARIATDYDIKVYVGASTSASFTLTSAPLDPNEEVTVAISAEDINAITQTTGTVTFTAKIEDEDDQEQANNNLIKTATWATVDFPVDGFAEAGAGGALTVGNMIPAVSFYYYDSVAQSIYTQAELGNVPAGLITHISYRYNMGAAITQNLQVRIYMVNKTAPFEFTGTTWVARNDFNLVKSYFQLSTTAGEHQEWIALDNPFVYTGGDIVVMTQKESSGGYNSTSGFYVSPTTQATSTLMVASDSGNYGDNNPSAAATALTYKPYMRVAFTLPVSHLELALTSFTGPANSTIDEPFVFTVKNNGKIEADQDNYSIKVYNVDPEVGNPQPIVTIPGRVIAGSLYASANITIDKDSGWEDWNWGNTLYGPLTLTAVIVTEVPAEDTSDNTLTRAFYQQPVHDLEVLSFNTASPTVLPTQLPIKFTVKNNGTAIDLDTTPNLYTVGVYNGDTFLPSIPITAVSIDGGEDYEFTIAPNLLNAALTAGDALDLKVRVTYPTFDQVPDNDELPYQMTWGPGNPDMVVEVGLGSTNMVVHNNSASNSPVGLYYNDSLSQTVYRADELLSDGVGEITQINYRVTLTAVAPNSQIVDIYMANYDGVPSGGFVQTPTPGSWVPFAQFTKVKTGYTLPLTQTGDINFWIPLDTAFQYEGGDLVVMVHKETTNGALSTTGSGFWYTTAVANTYPIIFAGSGTGNYNPANTYPNAGGRQNYKPQTKFAFAYPTGTDLSIKSISGPTDMFAGVAADTPIVITIRNNGSTNVAANAYSVKIYEGANPGLGATPIATISTTPAIDGNEYAEEDITIPCDASGTGGWFSWTVEGVGDVIFTARIEGLAGEVNTDNNTATHQTYILPEIDGAVTAITGPTTLPTAHPLNFVVTNIGSVAMAAGSYTVQVINDATDAVLHTITGNANCPLIAAAGTSNFTITAAAINTATAALPAGAVVLKLKVVLPGDQVPSNDAKTFEINKPYMGVESIQEIAIASTTTQRYVPFDMGQHDAITQSIYTATELGGTTGVNAVITHISYRYRKATTTATAITPYPVTIWLANSALTEFDGNNAWVALADFTQVALNYNLPINNTAGDYDLWIPLERPFLYTGGNIVVMTQKDHSSNYATTDVFFTTTGTNISLYRAGNNQSFTPNAPGAGTRVAYKPVMRVGYTNTTFGILTGQTQYMITSPNLLPLSGVAITQGTLSTTSGSNGTYTMLVNIGSGAELTFSKPGYKTYRRPSTITVENDIWTTTSGVQTGSYNPLMEVSVAYTVTGTVVTSDTGDPITGVATVNVGGQTGTTTAGVFTIANVYADSYYPVTITHNIYGLVSPFTTPAVFVDSEDVEEGVIDMGEFMLQEIFASPSLVEANIVNDNLRTVTWQAPGTTQQRISWDLNAGSQYNWNPYGYETIQAHKFTAARLSTLGVAGGDLSAVEFVPNSGRLSQYTIMIWTGLNLSNPNVAAPTYSQVVTQDITLGSWNTVTLTTPVNIPAGNELLIGIRTPDMDLTTMDNGNTAAFQAARGYGDVYHIAGEGWSTMYDDNGSQGYYDIWRIGGYVLVSPNMSSTPDPLASVGASAPMVSLRNAFSADTITPTRTRSSFIADSSNLPSTTPRHISRVENTRAFNGKYEVYRQVYSGGVWTNSQQLTPAEFTTLRSISDDVALSPALYRYAVRSVYDGDLYGPDATHQWEFSDPAYSNELNLAISVNVTVNVSGLIFDDDAEVNAWVPADVTGAFVVAHPGTAGVTLGAGETSATLALTPNRTYTITVSLRGFAMYQIHNLYVSSNQTLDVELTPVIETFYENFAGIENDTVPTDWVNEDANGDEYWWRFTVDEQGRPAAFSESLCWDLGQCVYPDNWLITPPIDLPSGAANLYLTYWAAPNSSTKLQERLFVYIMKADDIQGSEPSWSDFIDDMAPNSPAGGWDAEDLVGDAELLNNTTFFSGAWVPFNHDLMLYEGETVYIAFRHAHSRDMDALKLTDIQISYTETPRYVVTGAILYNNTFAPAGTNITFTSVPYPNIVAEGEVIGATGNYTLSDGNNAGAIGGNHTVRVWNETDPIFDYTFPTPTTVTGPETINFSVPTLYTVSGTLQAFAATPVPTVGADLVLTSPDAGTYYATSIAAGSFTFLYVGPGTYTLSAAWGVGEDATTWTHIDPVTVATANVTGLIVTSGIYRVSGTVTMFGPNTAIADASVKLNNIVGAGYSPAAVTTGVDGTFAVLTVPGEYTVKVTRTTPTPAIDWDTYDNVEVTTANVTNFAILVNELYSISGTLTTNDTAHYGVAGAAMTLMTAADTPVATSYTATSLTAGAFTFEGVRRGSYLIRAVGTYTAGDYSAGYNFTTPLSAPYEVVNANLVNQVVIITSLGDDDQVMVPTVTVLKSNYPNPFNPSTTIAFDMASAGHVSIEIYNVKGQRVRSLVNGPRDAGRYNVVWNGDDESGRNVGSGVYFYRMTTPEYSSVKKMLLMK